MTAQEAMALAAWGLHPNGAISVSIGVTEKRCCHCQRVLPLSEFTTDKSKPDGLTPRCRPCVNETVRAWHQNIKESRECGHCHKTLRLTAFALKNKYNGSPERQKVCRHCNELHKLRREHTRKRR